MRNACEILAGMSEGKRPVGTYGIDERINLS
jgi:hypothetical protein